jgi:hypothetical protein
MANRERLQRAAKLRELAARYKQLASCTTDETSVEVLKKMSQESEEEARRIEREEAVEHT